jgi:predicted Kef-type K+ transport protein
LRWGLPPALQRSWLSGLPLIGFLAAGFALNALGFERTPALDTIANLGVTLLLFTIGLKLDIKTLLRGEVWGSATLHSVGSTLLLASHLATAGLAKSLFHLKELFLVGFFLSLGLAALPDMSMVLMALLLLLVLPLKTGLHLLVLIRFLPRTRTGVLSTLALGNCSEFGLIVVAVAATAGWQATTA